MLKKISIFLSFILTINLVICNVYAIETIKQEDEHLLEDAISNPPSSKEPKIITTTTLTTKPLSSKNTVTTSPSKVFPTKEERSQARAEEKEWFSIRKKEEIMPTTPAQKDPLLEELKTAMHNCYKTNEEKLNIETSLLREGNLYNNTAYLTETFETINSCYESIGQDIIAIYYDNDPQILKDFQNKAKTFYVKATDTTFNANFCTENCSLDSLINNQINKFKEFRTYLSELINNRP